MKKFLISSFCIIIILLQGCNANPARYLNLKENKDKNHYSQEIIEKLKSDDDFKVEIFDNNFYKTYTLPEENKHIIPDFFYSLVSENFVDPINKNSNDKIFEIILKFTDQKYYITVINENYIYISPEDGYIQSDFINMTNIEEGLNLYKLCNYISKKLNPM